MTSGTQADARPDFSAWTGNTRTADDIADAQRVRALAVTLGTDAPSDTGAALRAPWHWLFFWPVYPLADAGPDGHEKTGGFLPPSGLPRRMWAGSTVTCHRPIHVGDTLHRVSRVASIEEKHGKSGPLLFVRVRHEISVPAGLSIVDEHDIVYREAPAPGASGEPPRAPADFAWERRIDPSPELLFRYSALTFNSHRIHYDQPYVTRVETYPGLVVHGPLTATLLLDLLYRNMPDARLKSFSFRGISPLFDIAPFFVRGAPGKDATVSLWAANENGGLAMTLTAELA